MLACPSCASVYNRSQEFCGLDGSRLVQVSEDPLIGRSIERYTIDRTLGSGGMARVYRAKHKVLDRRVAIKILYGELASDHQLARRFAREARSLSRIRHHHVVEVLDFGRTNEGLLYMIMELVEGHTLSYHIRRGPMPPAEAARIIQEIALGLDAAHRSGYVHRDLKPQNVVLDRHCEPETVKILDFGLVGLIEGGSGETPLTRQGAFFGTPTYMSPEQSAGENATPASDMYALGVVMYELLTGKPPFSGEVRQLAHQHLHTQPTRPPDTHPELTDLALRLLAKVPEQRPSSRELIAAINGMPLSPTDDEATQRNSPIAHDLQLSPSSNHPQLTPAVSRRNTASSNGSSSANGGPYEPGVLTPPRQQPSRNASDRSPWNPAISEPSIPPPVRRPSRPLSIAVPIDRDEFSVLDSSSSLYEKRGSGYRRFFSFALSVLVLGGIGAAGYTVYSNEIRPAPLAPPPSEKAPAAEEAEVATPDKDKRKPTKPRRQRSTAKATANRARNEGQRSDTPRGTRGTGQRDKPGRDKTRLARGAAAAPSASNPAKAAPSRASLRTPPAARKPVPSEGAEGQNRPSGGAQGPGSSVAQASGKPEVPVSAAPISPTATASSTIANKEASEIEATPAAATPTDDDDTLLYDDFLIMDDNLAGVLQDADLTWAALEAAHPTAARKWGGWYQGRVSISLQEAQALQKTLEDTITALADGDRSHLVTLLKTIKQKIDRLPDSIDDLTRTSLLNRFQRLKNMVSEPELPMAPTKILQALESLKTDLQEAYGDEPSPDDDDSELDASIKKITSRTSSSASF